MSNTYITTTKFDVEDLTASSIKEIAVTTIEIVNMDICEAYRYNIRQPNETEFNRTIIATDREEETLEHIYKTINNNSQAIGEARGDMKKLEQIFPNAHIELCAYTSEYWDDVRYRTEDQRTYLAEDQYQYNLLQIKVMEIVRDKFYERDMVASICLQDNPDQYEINKAINIIKKQKIEVTLIQPLLLPEIKNAYEKLVLKDRLTESLVINDTLSKKNKI